MSENVPGWVRQRPAASAPAGGSVASIAALAPVALGLAGCSMR